MTEEEIKKFAKEYVQNNTDESVNSFIGEQLQKAFIEGTDFMYYSNNEELRRQLTEKDKQIEATYKVVEENKEAKEIIKKFSEFANLEVEYDPEHPQEHTDLWNELCKEAEQFLKECEE